MTSFCMRNSGATQDAIATHVVLEEDLKFMQEEEETSSYAPAEESVMMMMKEQEARQMPAETTAERKKDSKTKELPPEAEHEIDPRLTVGDHVYVWHIPGMSQYHGLIVHVQDEMVTILDCNSLLCDTPTPQYKREHDDKQKASSEEDEASSESGKQTVGSDVKDKVKHHTISFPEGTEKYLYVENIHKTRWKKVHYSAGWLRRQLQFSGTAVALASDPHGLILARVHFLLENKDLVPPFHVFKSNSECVAVWCKTGMWSTLQGSSFLHLTAAGQVKSAASVALFVSAQQVTVPSAGMWGWLGYTSQVSLISTQPLLLPAIAGYGIVTVAGPMWMLHRYRKYWEKTTELLHEKFWTQAVARPDVFVECITHWSELQ